jgi:hypothetical protein
MFFIWVWASALYIIAIDAVFGPGSPLISHPSCSGGRRRCDAAAECRVKAPLIRLLTAIAISRISPTGFKDLAGDGHHGNRLLEGNGSLAASGIGLRSTGSWSIVVIAAETRIWAVIGLSP